MLKTLLMGTFAEQKQLISIVDAELNAWETHTPGTKFYFQEVMKELFVTDMYNNSKVFDKNDHVKRVENEICPYCGRNFIYYACHPTRSNKGTMVKPCIDHFLPKDQYPYLAMCYYNLIPSCTSCNNSPCKWTHDPIGDNRAHEYLMHPYEFDTSKIHFRYIPTAKPYKKQYVTVKMDCANADLEEGYKKWLNLHQFYSKHNSEVSKMYVQLMELQNSYCEFTKRNFSRLPDEFLKRLPEIFFGYQLSEEKASEELMYKFKSEIFQQLRTEI
jgi:hypothetical protein